MWTADRILICAAGTTSDAYKADEAQDRGPRDRQASANK